ncbi:MAG: hypothetical protein ACOCW6_01130, partial [Spirochaetota bacterium]
PAWVVGFQDDRSRPQWYVETSDGEFFVVSLLDSAARPGTLRYRLWDPAKPPPGQPRYCSLGRPVRIRASAPSPIC